MNALKKVGLFVALAVAANLVTVAALPWLINAVVLHKIAALAGDYNHALVAPRANAESKTIVRPSPDLLYTACVFDISERPLHVTAPVQDSYVSVSGFDANTNNFFAVNDGSAAPGIDGQKHFDLVIARSEVAVPAGAKLIVAPSDRGLILFRSLVTHEKNLARLQEFQSQQDCRPL